jgi:hypothetical protein
MARAAAIWERRAPMTEPEVFDLILTWHTARSDDEREALRWPLFTGTWHRIALFYIVDVIYSAATGEPLRDGLPYPASDKFRAECCAYLAKLRSTP